MKVISKLSKLLFFHFQQALQRNSLCRENFKNGTQPRGHFNADAALLKKKVKTNKETTPSWKETTQGMNFWGVFFCVCFLEWRIAFLLCACACLYIFTHTSAHAHTHEKPHFYALDHFWEGQDGLRWLNCRRPSTQWASNRENLICTHVLLFSHGRYCHICF